MLQSQRLVRLFWRRTVNIDTRQQIRTVSSMPQVSGNYPGLDLPIRYFTREFEDVTYPMGAHGNCLGAKSDLLPVRELAMLSVMEQLTDKPDWEKKVFDDAITAKWRDEALAIPDKDFCKLAESYKRQHWGADGNVELFNDWQSHTHKLKDILNANAFDCVSCLAFALSAVPDSV